MSEPDLPVVTDRVDYQDLQRQLHVWLCVPEAVRDAQRLATYAAMLSDDERRRWQRFRFERDRHSYLVSHALVRTVLSKYANVAPADWCFGRNVHGRPRIVPPASAPDLHFNLSHSRGLTACVVSSLPSCGVDVECVMRRGRLRAVARRMFAEDELACLPDADGVDFRRQFFAFWTLREAYVKALGSGLSGSSKRFGFELDSQGGDEPVAAHLMLAGGRQEARLWQFDLMRPTPGHVVAVALRHGDGGRREPVRHWIVP